MIENIKVKVYKGISELRLTSLKHINVICGKNSSGKSSILEALATKEKAYIGKPTDVDIIIDLITPNIKRFTSPSPTDGMSWLKGFATDFQMQNPIFYSDEDELIYKQAKESIMRHAYLKQFGDDQYNLKPNFSHYAQTIGTGYNPILIPPKRGLEANTKVSPNEILEPNGKGCVNHLFFLKNQDTESKQYKIYHQIHQTFREITAHKFNIILDADHSLKLQFEQGGIWRHADDCGLGLRDLLIIITFVLATEYSLYLIEEPESHLHADFQKKLINRLLKKANNKQFILSTHSPVFLDVNAADKIFYCWFEKGKVKLSDDTTLSKITNMLGHPVTEILTSDALIFVEGPTDVPVFQTILNWYGAMDKYNIRMWPLGGDIMGSLDMTIFGGRNNVFAIIDNDPGSKPIRDKFKKNCEDAAIPVIQLEERYAIENYFTLEAIRSVFGNSIPEAVIKLTPKTPVDTQIGFAKLNKSIKSKNADIIVLMQSQDILNTDLESGIKRIIEAIEANQPKGDGAIRE